jgi:NAD(P)-dependent dehydrogenase (short-subunit alcohol dehydrogenase family)
MNILTLKNKVVIITGGSTGLGLSICKQFLLAGACTWSLDRIPTPKLTREDFNFVPNIPFDLDDLASRFQHITLDICQEQEVIKAFRDIYQKHSNLDVLVNNAAVNFRGSHIDSIDGDQVELMLKTNIAGAFYCAREYTKYARNRVLGQIINVSSNAAVNAPPGESLYAASKWALRAFTLCWAAEMASFGIAVNEIEPGVPIRTRMSETVYDDDAKSKWADPDEISESFVNLAFRMEKRVTGQRFLANELLRIQS